MKKNSLLFRSLFSLAFGLISVAALGQRFEKLIETRTISNHEIVGAEYESTSKSIFILANVSNSNGDGLLIKVNSLTGDTLWTKFVAPTTQAEQFKGLYLTTNALFAYGYRTYQSNQYAFVAKLDFNGDTIWTKHYKSLTTSYCSNGRIRLNGLAVTSSGDIAMVGYNTTCDRAVFLKANSSGVIASIKEYDQWKSAIYSPIWEFYDIKSSGTNFYVSARYATAGQNWTYYKGIWKLDATGDTLAHYNSSFSGNSDVYGFDIDPNGNMYLVGRHNPVASWVGIVEKFNSSGASQWTYSPSGSTLQESNIEGIDVLTNGDVLVAGYLRFQNFSDDQFVAKIGGANGTEIWSKKYGYNDWGYGKEILSIGGNFALISAENFGWSANRNYGTGHNNPPHAGHPVLQIIDANGSVGKFRKTPDQSSKNGKLQFFPYASFSFESDSWSNVSLVPITLASPTGGTSGYNSWNNNFNYEIWKTSQSSNQNGVGTFYFTAQDKNGDLRASDTLEVLTFPSFTALDQYGSPATAACSGDSLHLTPDVLNPGAVYKWFYTGVSNNLTASKLGNAQSFYVKNKGYYFMREILSNGDSAQTEPALLNISTDQVQIYSSDYPQSFWVSGEVSDSLTRPNPSVLNLALNTNNQHWLAPVGRYRQSNVQQYYYSVSDLQARGLSAGSAIDEIGFVFEEAYSGGNLEEFKISLKWNTTMPSAWVTLNSNNIVYDPYWQDPSSSDGEIHFDINDQIWDGVSSLIIQVSYRVNSFNVSTDVNPIFKLEKGTSTLSRFVQANNTSTTLVGNNGAGNKSANYRPLTKFKMALPAKTDTIVGCSSNISISVANSGYQLLSWNTSATSSSLTVSSAGEYSVTMIDGNFCLSYDTVQVVFNPNTNSITASADTVVSGSSVTLTGQNSYLNLWSNGASGNTTTVTSSGDYTLTSINSDGCPVIDTATVIVVDLPVIYKGNRALYRGAALSNHTYMGEIGNAHVYYSTNCYSFNAAQSTIGNLGGKFWYPKDASENALINSLYKSKISCCGGRWIGIKRSSTSDPWKDVYGNTIPYENWDVNADPNRLFGYIEFSWNGFWNGTSSGTNDCREYFIGFEDESSVAGSTETACDSIKLWTPEGYDSYIWTNGATTLTSTSNEIWAVASGSYTVTGVRNNFNYNSTAVQLTINESPSISITNKSGTTDLNGTNSITLKATYPAGATLNWLVNGQSSSTNDSIVSNTVGTHTLVGTLNGCSSRDSVQFFAPIYVATTGDNSTGDGTLSNPYKTITYGISQASTGDRIYVLPGTYQENLVIGKAINLQSDYDRLGDTNALHTTIIDGGGAGIVVKLYNYNSASTTVISGFTIKNGYNSNDNGSGVLMQDVTGEGLQLLNCKLTENTRQCCNEGISFTQFGGKSYLQNVRFINNGSPSYWDERRDVAIRSSATSVWENVRYAGNESQYDLIAIMDGSDLTVTNSIFTTGLPDNGHGLFGMHGNNGDLVLNHVTIWGNKLGVHNDQYVIKNHSNSNSTVTILNSIIDAGQDQIVEIQQNNSYFFKNNVFKGSILTGTGTLDSSRVLWSNGYVNSNGSIATTSRAIGHARMNTSANSTTYSTPSNDIFGNSRPSPAGSNPDAGAYESNLSIGAFGLGIEACGYVINVEVLNSSNFSTSWSGPNGFSSQDTSLIASEEGTYVLTVISIDRGDTISETVEIANPLRATITTKDVCIAAGNNSGYLDIRNVQGGTPFTGLNVATHKWGLKKNGVYVQGPNWDIWGSTWYWNGNLTAGDYVLEIKDEVCALEYPFTLDSKAQRSVFVDGQNGSNSNNGLLSSPYASIQYAINQACDRDTIFLLDGTITEDSILIDKDVIISSLYTRDGDTNHISNAIVDANFMEAAFYVNVQTGNWNQPSDTAYKKFIGFTIKNGLKYSGLGGGVNVTRGNVVFRKMIFDNNEGSNGGGIHVNMDAGTILVDQSLFKENTAIQGSGFWARGGYFVIKRSTFLRNQATSSSTVHFDNWCCGQGGYVNDTKFLFNEAQNYAVGEWDNWIDGQPRTISKNITAIGNKSTNGPLFRLMGVGNGSEVVLNNWLVAKNEWPSWQSMFEYNWMIAQVNHATIVQNQGGPVFRIGEEGKLYVTNSIIDNNGGSLDVSNSQAPTTTKTYFSNVAWNASIPSLGTHAHVNNVSLTGLYFSDSSNGNYSLARTASVIGAGKASITMGNKTIVSPTKDVLGNPRPNPAGSNPDLGAYETIYQTPQVGINISVRNPTICDSLSGSVTSLLVNATGNFEPTWKNFNGVVLGTGATLSNIGAGDYIVYYVDSTATIQHSDTALVRIPDDIAVSINFIPAECSEDRTTLSVQPTGGTPIAGGKYSITVTLDSSLTHNKSYAKTSSGTGFSEEVPTGYYSIKVEDGAGCSKVFNIDITYNKLSPSVTILSKNGSFEYLGTPLKLYTNRSIGSILSWSGGATTDTITVQSQQWILASANKDGCTTIDSQFVSVPKFVSVNGDNQNTGTLQAPFKTIQHGINQSTANGVLYVLPGTYNERILIDKPLTLASDVLRLGDTNAVRTTIIKPGSVGIITSVSNSNTSSYGGINVVNMNEGQIKMIGFSVKDYQANYSGSWDRSSVISVVSSTADIDFENLIISGSKQGQGQGCCNAAVTLDVEYSSNVSFNDVRIKNNGDPSWTSHRLGYIRQSTVNFENSRWTGNDRFNSILRIGEGAKVNISNSVFANHGGDDLFELDESNASVSFNHVTIVGNEEITNVFKIGGSNNKVYFINSVLEDDMGNRWMYAYGSNNSMFIANSIVGGTNKSSFTSSNLSLDTNGLTQFISPALNTGGGLKGNSPAIGNARTIAQIDGKTFSSPILDLKKISRPNPTGSNPDAGAFESPKSQGDFDVAIDACGYELTSQVFNSSNYLVEWSGPSGYFSISKNITAPRKGLYTLSVFSLDRTDTISKTLNLNNPLTFEIMTVKDVCEGVSSNSGRFMFGQVKGGIPYTSNWWTHTFEVKNSSGTVIDGWQFNSPNWTYSRNNASAGRYYIEVTDGAGCTVVDSLDLESKLGQRWYVSTTGNDANPGTELLPLKSVQLAYDLACDQDTIIIEDGTYYENLELGDAWQNNDWQYAKPVTIASRFILDGQASHIAAVILNGSDEAPVLTARFNGSTDSTSNNVVRLVGMTITRGNAISYNWWGGNRGGGLALFERGYVLENLKIRNNNSSDQGGGIFIDESAILRNVDVFKNSAPRGAGIYLWNIAELDWENVNVFDNTSSDWAAGVGIQGSMSGDVTISGMNIYDNQNTGWGGASALQIDSWGSGKLTLKNFKVTSNTNVNSDSWGAVYVSNGANKGVVFENALIAFNKGGWVAGVNIQNSADVSFVNSTIYRNLSRAGYTGTNANSSIYLTNNSELNLYNSILGGQTGYNIIIDQGNNSWGGADCDVNIKNSLIQGGISSTSILTTPGVTGQVTDSAMIVEPVYLKNPGQGDFSLAVMSSALGAANHNPWLNPGSANNPVYLNMPQQDLFGTNRPNPVGSNSDLGAIESDLSTPQFGVAFEITSNPACNPSAAQIKATAKHPLGGPYKYSWVSLDGNTINNPNSQLTSGAYTISNLYAGWYKLTVQKYSGSTVLETIVDSVQITQDAPINLGLLKSDENCEGESNGSLQLDVVGGSGRYFITWTYPGGGSVPNAPSTISQLSPGAYSVTVTDDRGCTAQDTISIITAHPTPTVSITSSIAKPGSTLLGNNEVRMCVGDIVTLDAGAGFADYNWTSLTVSANQYSTRTIEAFESETYYLSVVDSFGCANSDSARVYVIYPPVVYASNLNAATGASLQGVTTTVLGLNETTSNSWSSQEPHPYGAGQRYGKVQFIIRATELYQAGLTQNTNINSLSLYVQNAGSSVLNTMSISMGHTGQSSLTSWVTGLQQVFSINNYFPVGETWNIHNFTKDFKWDGAQNILVEVCFDYGVNPPSSVEILQHQIYGNVQLTLSSHTNINADNCMFPSNMNGSPWRPNVQLGIDKIQAVDTIRVCDFSTLNTAPVYDTYRWYVNGSQIPDTTVINVATTATSLLRVTDAASGCILWSDTIVIQVDSTSAMHITSDLPMSGTLCLGDTVSLSTNKAFASYFWSNGDTSRTQLVTKSETFVLKAVSENGCPSFDTATVSINVPPDVYFRLNGRVLASTDQSLVYSSGAENCTEVRYVPSEDHFDVAWGATNFIIATGYQAVKSIMDSLLYPWANDGSQPKDWILHKDATDTQFSGPSGDATSSDGHGGYLLFNPYSGTDENKTAAIVSPCINLLGTNQPAVVFNYHMYTNVVALGANSDQQMGSLKVEVQDVTLGETGWTTVWMRETPTATIAWVMDTADLSAFAGHTVKIRLKAQAGTGGPNGEIAVDGISFTDVNPSNPVLNRLTPETVCEGDILEAGSSDVLSNNMSYVWNTGETGANLTLHTTGWYSVTLVDSNNCEISTDSVFVLVNPEPVPNLTVSASDTLQYCDGQMGNVVLQVPGGFSEYAWFLNGTEENTSGDTLNTGVLAVGSYSYSAIITDSIGCTSTSEAIGIDVRALPSLQTAVTDANCYGDTNGVVALTVVGNGGYTFNWSNGDTTATILNLGADTLTVFVTDSFSCESTIDVVVNQPTAVNSYHYSVEPDCFGGSDGQVVVNTFGGVAPYHFNWTSLPNALDSVEVTFQLHGSNWNTTTYSVAFTNGQIITLQPNYLGDSTLRATVKLPANQTIYYRYYQGSIPENVPTSCGQIPSGNSTMHRTLNVSADVTLGAVCYGQCYDCNGVFQSQIAGSTTYGNKIARGLGAGQYAYTVTDAHGCTYSVTDSVDQPTLLTVAMDSYGDLSCYQSGDGFINLTVAGGTLPYSYNWSTGAISEDLTNLQAGTYTMTVTDGKGCTASWSGQISEPAILEAQGVVSSYAAGMNVSCNGANDGSIDVSVTGGTMPYTYAWSNSASTQDLSSLTAGTYTVTVTDTNGCTDALSFTLVQPASIAASTTQTDVDCFGGDNGSITVNATGGTAPYAMDWTSATGASSGEVAVSFQVNMGGQTWSVGGIELFVQSYGTHLMTDFAGDSIYRKTLTFMPGDTIYYRYAKSSVPENVPTSCGIITGSTLVQRYVVVPAQDTTLSIVCFASCTDCDGAVRGQANGAFMTGARTLNGLTAGVYTFNMVDLNGCTYSVTDSVDQPTLLVTVVDSTYDATCPVNNDGGIELHAAGGVAPYTYQWSNGSSQNNQLFLYAGTYSVLITDFNGCTDSLSYVLNAPQPFDQQEICVLSVDSLTGKNLIVWEHTPGFRTSDYVLLKENSQGQYVQIGTQSYTNLSVYTDLTSIPQQQPDRYRIALMDSCGTLSDTSDLHRTIHLQSNIGSGGEINLIWTPYEGRSVQTYEIFRWITSGNLVQIGSVSGGTTTFTDLNPPVASNVYYVINAVFNGDACSPTLGKTSAFEGSKSNILNQTGIGTPELPWRGRVLLYPNPSTGDFRIEVPTEDEYQVIIYNAVGKRLLVKTYTETAEVNLENVAEGLYYVEIQQEGSVMSIEKINIVH